MVTRYRTIVVGTDGSETARIAEHAGAALARAEDARLILASAFAASPDRAERILEESLRAIQDLWPKVEVRAARGEASEALVGLAREEGADLLLVGNKGMTGRAAFLLGSVPDRISHNAPCDLLIVRTSSGDAIGQRRGTYRKVLIATDASQTSLRAVRRGYGLAERVGATPVLFYAGHPRTADIVFGEVARAFLPAGMLQTASANGDPAEVICRTAQVDGYDLIVIGNKGMLGGRFHIGNVPNRVSHQASTDLLIVRTTSASIADLENGDGAVVRVEEDAVAAYRDDGGTVHMLSPRCSHMGCTVDWNGDDRTWDCPCHGSRYDALGEVIRGPATRGLAKLENGAAVDEDADA